MSSKKSRAKKRARQNGGVGGIQSYAINLGGQTSVVERGSKAERDLLSRGGVAGTEADKTNRSSYLKSLNNPSSPNYVTQDAFGSTITGDSLKQELPIPLPEQPKPINYNGMVSGAISSVGGVNGVIPPVDTTPVATSDAQTQADKLKSLLGVYSEPISQSDIYAQAEKEAQTQKYTKRVNRYQNQLNAITAKSQADQLSVTGQGRGIPEAIIGGQQAQISKEAAIASLPVAAQLSAAQGDLEIAQSHLDNLFKIRSADAQANADYRDKLAKLTYDFFDKAEKAQLDKADAKTKDNALRRTDSTNFAQSVMSKLINDGNVSGASAIAGLEQPDPTSKTFEQDLVNYNKKVLQYSGSGGGGSGASLAGYTPEQQADPFVQLLAKTAGGKPITDTFAQSLNKGLNVLGQIGGLQTNIKDVKTGPILGLFRGANPWDTNAQTIKAQLNAIVPNLARGVYGEVGVLTDNDIAQYSKTLPNLKSTDDIRNAVLGITVDLIGKSIKRTLEINAANKKDVSGFIDIYTEMNNTRDSIFSQIPGYKGKGSGTFVISTSGGGSLDLSNFEN